MGLQTDRAAYDLIQRAKEKGELDFRSHATAKEQIAKDVFTELEESADSVDVESGVLKFVKWLRSGKQENEVFHNTLKRLTND